MRPTNLYFRTNHADKSLKSFLIKKFLKKESEHFDDYYDEYNMNNYGMFSRRIKLGIPEYQ